MSFRAGFCQHVDNYYWGSVMIDINKKYTTRDGREVAIYAVYPDIKWGVHGAIKNYDGTYAMEDWTHAGTYAINGATTDCDLIEAPQVVEMTVIDALLHINRQVAKTSMSDEQTALMDKCFTILHSLVGENPYFTVKK
jgi:hypothetical protein